MVAEQHLTSLLPCRRPHWRLNRVTKMLGQRQQPLRPGRKDDHSIRVYRRLHLQLLAAGADDVKLTAVSAALPAVYEAHQYHYSPDLRTRQEIEARLLTREPVEEIASKLGADPKAIEYYAALFFDVRDALDHRDWIALMIRSRMRYDEKCGCSRAEAEHGYVLRLFGYFGGPLVLDALLNPLGAIKPPQNAGEVRTWSQEAGTQIVRARGTAAAATMEITGKNVMQFIRLAQRQIRGRKTELGSGDDVNKHFEAALEWFEKAGLK